jgi:hypothetical protein
MQNHPVNRPDFFAGAQRWRCAAFVSHGNPVAAAAEASSPAKASRANATWRLSPADRRPEARAALAKSFDLLGGIGSLVKNKTVTVKLNLTGTNFAAYLDRPVGETYMTHYATALALGSLLFDAGAKRVRFVESTQSKAPLESTLALADWDVKALEPGQSRIRKHAQSGQGRELRAPARAFRRPHVFSLRLQPRLRRNGRDDFASEVEEPHHRRRDAFDEEPVRHYAQFALR